MRSAYQDYEKRLSLFDSVCLIVGSVVGIGIFETIPVIAAAAGDTPTTLAVWLIGGALSLIGALCWAELATAYPETGGEYVYLKRAFGMRCAFLFARSELTIVRPGAIAALSFPFAHYALSLWSDGSTPLDRTLELSIAPAGILILTVVNMLGVRAGKGVQNALTVAKVIGIAAIVGCAFAAERPISLEAPVLGDPPDLGLAMILVLFTYGGWNEIVYVAAEVRQPERNLHRALLVGLLLVLFIYLAMNLACVRALGFEEVTKSTAVATDAVRAVLTDKAAPFISALIIVCALGAMNGFILAGARVPYAMGMDHRVFSFLAHWDSQRGAPTAALAVQAAISSAVVLLAGSFSMTVVYTSTVVWCFFLLSALSLFILRRKEPERLRTYRAPGHPVTTAVFSAACLYLIVEAIRYNPVGSAFSLLMLCCGPIVLRLFRGGSTEDGNSPSQ